MQTTERNRAQTSTRFLRSSSGNPFATQNSFFHRHSSDPKPMSHSHSLLRTFFSRSYRCGSTGFHDPKLWIKKDKLKRTKGFMRDFAWMNGGEWGLTFFMFGSITGTALLMPFWTNKSREESSMVITSRRRDLHQAMTTRPISANHVPSVAVFIGRSRAS